MMWAVATWTQFQFAVGNIINANVRGRSLHHFHILTFGGFVADQFDVVIGGVQIDAVPSTTRFARWTLTQICKN